MLRCKAETFRRRAWVAFLSTLLLLAQAGQAQEPTLTLAERQQLLSEIKQTLSTKAFASTVDFLGTRPVMDVPEEEVQKAGTHKEFASLVNRHFRQLKISHLELSTPEEVAMWESNTQVGPGVATRKSATGAIVVHEVFPGSAAAKAGIKPWDELRTVDGRPIQGYGDLVATANSVRTLTYTRAGKVHTAKLLYKPFSSYRPNSMKWLTSKVAVISVNTFVAGVYSPEKMDSFFKKAAGARTIVLDLRYNRGGALTNVFDLMGHVLPSGTVVGRGINRDVIASSGRTFASAREAYDTLSKDPISEVRLTSSYEPYQGNLIVLTSHLAGSGGDRFPGTIRDLKRGTLIGRRTIGALLTGDRQLLTKGFELLYPFAEVLMPSGERIEGVGVPPDIELSEQETLDDKSIFKAALKADEERFKKSALGGAISSGLGTGHRLAGNRA